MSTDFKDLELNQEVEVYFDVDHDGGLMLWDHLPSDIDLSQLKTLNFQLLGLNNKYYSENNQACVMIKVPASSGWTFTDQEEINSWKNQGWNLSNKIDETISVYLVSIKTIHKIKSAAPKILLKKSGHFCIECKNYYPYAEANMSDDRLLCYSCRSCYSWKYR